MREIFNIPRGKFSEVDSCGSGRDSRSNFDYELPRCAKKDCQHRGHPIQLALKQVFIEFQLHLFRNVPDFFLRVGNRPVQAGELAQLFPGLLFFRGLRICTRLER